LKLYKYIKQQTDIRNHKKITVSIAKND